MHPSAGPHAWSMETPSQAFEFSTPAENYNFGFREAAIPRLRVLWRSLGGVPIKALPGFPVHQLDQFGPAWSIELFPLPKFPRCVTAGFDVPVVDNCDAV